MVLGEANPGGGWKTGDGDRRWRHGRWRHRTGGSSLLLPPCPACPPPSPPSPSPSPLPFLFLSPPPSTHRGAGAAPVPALLHLPSLTGIFWPLDAPPTTPAIPHPHREPPGGDPLAPSPGRAVLRPEPGAQGSRLCRREVRTELSACDYFSPQGPREKTAGLRVFTEPRFLGKPALLSNPECLITKEKNDFFFPENPFNYLIAQ